MHDLSWFANPVSESCLNKLLLKMTILIYQYSFPENTLHKKCQFTQNHCTCCNFTTMQHNESRKYTDQ